jgi:hypothetical protein
MLKWGGGAMDEEDARARAEATDRAERIIRHHAAHLAEHPRCAWVEVARYPPQRLAARSSIHLTVAFPNDDAVADGIDHAALSARVMAETGLEIDPEYTGVFHWRKRNLRVYWWDWRTPARS